MDEIEQAHAAVGGTGRGRRYATQQVNQAYAVLLASQFQGFCRDLHSESVDHLVTTIAPPPGLLALVQTEFTRGRQIDRGNARPSSIGADIGRLGIGFWTEVNRHHPNNAARKTFLETLNDWRSAIDRQDFDPSKLGGKTTLRLIQVRRWRVACHLLARAFDEVLRLHLEAIRDALNGRDSRARGNAPGPRRTPWD
ncbi:MAG TPA: hypothetical protein VF590_18825, partial [Isosphaeraceae bacterium]